MKYILNLYTVIAIAVLSIVIAQAQTGSNAIKHYDKAGLVFDYPDGWDLDDDSSESMPTVTLTRPGSVAQIVIRMQATHFSGIPPVRRGVTTIMAPGNLSPERTAANRDACDFESNRKKIADALTEGVAFQIHTDTTHRQSVTAQIANTDVEGIQLKGVVGREPVTGNVYSLRLNRQFVSLIYIRADDDERAKSAWNTVRTTLTVGPKALTLLGASIEEDGLDVLISPGISTGRVVSLPQPKYPKIAKSAHAAGTVTVQVVIDETGDVISAVAVEGHPLLQAVSVAAARQAKFSTTKLCGEPVKVAGVITYDFVAQ